MTMPSDKRRVIEQELFPLGWTIADVARVIGCDWMTVKKDLGDSVDALFPNRLRDPEERFQQTLVAYAQMARYDGDKSAERAILQAFGRVLNIDAIRAAFETARQMAAQLGRPDMSALPQWQQRLIRDLFPVMESIDVTWGQFLKAVASECISITPKGYAQEIAQWVIKETHVRSGVRQALDASWAKQIEAKIEEVANDTERELIELYYVVGETRYDNIARALKLSARSARMKREVLLGKLRGQMRNLQEALGSSHVRITMLTAHVAKQKRQIERSWEILNPDQVLTVLCGRGLENLGVSARTFSILNNNGLRTIGQLVQCDPHALRDNTCSRSVLKEVERKLLELEYAYSVELSLGMDVPAEVAAAHPLPKRLRL